MIKKRFLEWNLIKCPSGMDSPLPFPAHLGACSVVVSQPSSLRAWAFVSCHLCPGLGGLSHFHWSWRKLHIKQNAASLQFSCVLTTSWFITLFHGNFLFGGETWCYVQHSLTTWRPASHPLMSGRWIIRGWDTFHLLVEVNQCWGVSTVEPTAEYILIWLFSLQAFPSFRVAY